MGLSTWWKKLTGRGGNGGDARSGDAGDSTRGDGTRPDRPGRTPKPDTPVEQPTGHPGSRPTPDAAQPVLGLVADGSGWIGAVLDADGTGTPRLVRATSLTEALEAAGPVAVTVLSVPLGLPDGTRRTAEGRARALLGQLGSTVLSTPVREAVYAGSYSAANAVNREKVGSGVSRQAYELRRRIREADAWLRQDLPTVPVEGHPEVSLATANNGPLESRPGTAPGRSERHDVLARAGVFVPGQTPHGMSADQVVAACALAWTGHRVRTGAATTLPSEPETFSDGIPAAIHA